MKYFFSICSTVIVLFFFVACSFQGGEAVDRPGEEDMFEDISSDGDHEEKEDIDEDHDQSNGGEHNDADEKFDQDDEEFDDIDPVEQIVIATYNTEFFFDTICDSGYCGPDDFELQLTPAEYAAKVEDVADALRLINADVVLLQEVEKQICLDDLLDELDDMYDAVYLGEKGGPGSMNTAVVTKGKITLTNKHLSAIPLPGGGTTTFTRAFLEVRITYEGRKIIVFSAHFKSKNDDDPNRRQAEANAALEILIDTASYNSDALIVFGGDLNDVPGSEPVNTLENSSSLFRVASELSSVDQATYWYQGPIAIDHIFHVLDGKGEYISGTAEVIKDSPDTYKLMDSDHAALRAAFLF